MKKLFTLFLTALLTMAFTLVTNANSLAAKDYLDFNEGLYWADEMTWAIDKGVLNGYPTEKKIKPNNTLSEAQFLTMLFRVLNSEELDTYIQNLNTNDWTPQYAMAKKYNLAVSYKNTANWNKPIRRGTVAKLFAESLTGKQMSENEAVQWMYNQNISDGQADKNGVFPKTYDSYLPNSTLTRAQVVVFLYNISTNKQIDQSLKVIERKDVVQEKLNEFSFNGIEIKDSIDKVKQIYGEPKRITYNDDGLEIHTYYRNNYDDFLIVGLDESKHVAYLYSNQVYTARYYGLDLLNQESITSIFGKGYSDELTKTTYQGNTITFYYDTHLQGMPVRALQVKDPNWSLTDVNFETSDYLIFDVTNSYRYVYNLKPLKWFEQISNTAYKHSKDMYDNNFFDHTNLQGLDPFDRMAKDGLDSFSYAGENIAMGYTNGIDATEGWMNSKTGHREAILNAKFTHLGVGSYRWFYTQNFYTPQ